jgi:hypothetical protein
MRLPAQDGEEVLKNCAGFHMKKNKLRKFSYILVIAVSLAFCIGSLCDDDDSPIGLLVACIPPGFYQLTAPVFCPQGMCINAGSDICLPESMVSYLSMREKSPPHPFVSIFA